MSADLCPECDHEAHPATDCLVGVYDEHDEPRACGCPPRCPECLGNGHVITPDQREHRCASCHGSGEAAA